MVNYNENIRKLHLQNNNPCLDLRSSAVSKIYCSILIILTLLAADKASAQNIDSLKGLLPNRTGIKKCDVLYELAYACIDIDNKASVEWSNKSLQLASIAGDSMRIVRASRIKAYGFRRLGMIDSSLRIYNYLLPIARRHNLTQEIKHTLNVLSLNYVHKSFYDKALKYGFESLELREKDGDKAEVSMALNNIGVVYFKLEDYDKALDYFLRSLDMNRMRVSSHLITTLVNISVCYAYESNYKQAKKFVDEAISTCGGQCLDELQMQADFALGLIAFSTENYLEAEEHFYTSFQLASQLKNERFQLDNIVYLTQTYLKNGKVQEVKSLAEISESLLSSKLTYNQGMIEVYAELIKVYERSDEPQKVKLYQKRYIELKDSLFSYQFAKNLMRVEADYIGRENQARMDAKNKILRLNEDVIVRQRYVNIFIGVVAILLMVLAYILSRMNRQKRTANQLLELRVRERTRELEVNRDLLARSLEERSIEMQRISVDVKRNIATIKGLCMLGMKEGEGLSTSQYIDKIDCTSDQLLSIVNRFVSN
ncbi:MAG TPA: tetratricopeptide repeat protein [Chryseolinea sp.]|nr:tetratricopeptide repeat protein [Chryseolinea sp.]